VTAEITQRHYHVYCCVVLHSVVSAARCCNLPLLLLDVSAARCCNLPLLLPDVSAARCCNLPLLLPDVSARCCNLQDVMQVQVSSDRAASAALCVRVQQLLHPVYSLLYPQGPSYGSVLERFAERPSTARDKDREIKVRY
jgi:hypothetical protein